MKITAITEADLLKQFGLLIILFWVMSLSAQTPTGMKIGDVALKILEGSPEYQSETYDLESVIAGLETQGNLPDPEISGEYLVMPKDVDNRWTAQLEWSLEWPGVYGARNREAKKRMTSAQLSMMTQRYERLAQIKDLLLDYVRCRKKMALLEELSRNNDTIYNLAEQAARGGEMTLLDLNKVKLEYANIRVTKAALIDEEAVVIGELSTIYGRDCMNLLKSMECEFPELNMPSETQLAGIKENAPSVKEALAEMEAAGMGMKVARMEALPSISFGYKHAFEDAMHFNGGVLGISVPIFSSKGKQKAARAEMVKAESKAEQARLEVENDVEATLRRLDMLTAQIKEIAPLVENADYNATLLRAYKNGVITLIEYISDRNYFTAAALELVNLRHNAAKALAFLQRYYQ